MVDVGADVDVGRGCGLERKPSQNAEVGHTCVGHILIKRRHCHEGGANWVVLCSCERQLARVNRRLIHVEDNNRDVPVRRKGTCAEQSWRRC